MKFIFPVRNKLIYIHFVIALVLGTYLVSWLDGELAPSSGFTNLFHSLLLMVVMATPLTIYVYLHDRYEKYINSK